MLFCRQLPPSGGTHPGAVERKQPSPFFRPMIDGRSAKVSTENIVSVNRKKRTAATNVSKLQVGDVLELTFPDDRTIWKAVVIENGGDTTSTREPRRLVRIPNPWQRESPRESPADGGHPAVPPVRYRDHEKSHSPPSEKSHQEKPLGSCTKSEKTARYVCMRMYVYGSLGAPTYTCMS